MAVIKGTKQQFRLSRCVCATVVPQTVDTKVVSAFVHPLSGNLEPRVSFQLHSLRLG